MTTTLRIPRPLGDTETGHAPASASSHRGRPESRARASAAAPSAHSSCTIDASELLSIRHRLASRPEYRESPLPLIVFLAQAVLAAELVGDRAQPRTLGVAEPSGIALLRLPAKPLPGLSDLVARLASTRRVGTHELPPGSILLRSFEAESGSPTLPPGASAAIGVGAVQQRPWAVNGALSVRPTLTLTLSEADGTGGPALNTIAEFLSEPHRLLTWR